MKERTTKYTNIISVFFIFVAALIFFFQLPSNQISIPSTNLSLLFYTLGMTGFLSIFTLVMYYLPMLFVIKISCRVQLVYINQERIKVSFLLPKFIFVNRNKYKKLCVIRC